jgi:hypothetical protein
MKRVFNFLVFTAVILLFSSSVFAQSAKIIDLKGKVSVKKELSAAWQEAKINMLLLKDAEIKTASGAICTLAFDEELKNIMSIKENSEVKLESIIPAQVFLPEGRVFSLIDNLSAIEKFEVRTPTAIAGARGTGFSVESLNGQTLASCYKHFVYLMGLDKQGNTGEIKELAEKFGITINPDGTWEGPLGLSPEAMKEWQDFLGYLESLKGDGQDEGDSLGGLQDESKESLGDSLYENRRAEEEGREGGQIEPGQGPTGE